MANIHILDNGNPFNNGVMAMALGFRDGLIRVCGRDHLVTVLLNTPSTFIPSARRYSRYGLSTVPNGLARWRSGPPKCGRIFSKLLPVTGRFWSWGQRHDVGIAHLVGWKPKQADIVVSLCGEDYFSDNWPLSLCKFTDIQYSFLEKQGIPHVVMAQTFGPFTRSYSRLLAEKHLAQAALVTARDDVSFDNVTEDLGITNHVHRTGDLAFLMEPDEWSMVKQRHTELRSLHFAETQWVGVSVSRLFARSVFKTLSSRSERIEAFFMQFAVGLDSILAQNDDIQVLFTPHVTEKGNDDRDANQEVIQRMKSSNRVVALRDEYTAPEIKAVIGRCDAFIGCRMHALIAAVSQAVPTLPLAYSPKTMDVIGKAMDYPFAMDFRNMEPHVAGVELVYQFTKIWREREKLRVKLQEEGQKTKALSYRNFELLRSLL
jgi:colanic acid/amylovoran biosynthesis protein WcaK/AmsJ